ncbi:hypothetical protein PAMA_001922 [Pampus argenteus]
MERGIMAREEEEERRGQPEEEVGGDDGVEGAEEENGGQDGDVEEELDRRYGSDSGDGGGKDDDVEMTEEGRKVEDDVVTKETDDNRWREEQQAVEGGELQRQVGGGEREGKETKEPVLAAKRKADRSRRGRGRTHMSDRGLTSDIVGVSRRTIYRRMQEYNISVRSLYSTMTDDALDDEVRAIKSRLPHGRGPPCTIDQT